MSHRSSPRVLVLHALRLKGVVEVPVAAAAAGLAVADVADELATLADDGLAIHRGGLFPGWGLTSDGRREHARLLREELEAVGARAVVEDGYGRFRALNPSVLDAVSRWQVRSNGSLAGGDSPDALVRNDHTDATYDARVLDDLEAAFDGARPIGQRLGLALARFAPYAPHLDNALERARAGDLDYVAKPVIPSFHTVWFEWHEDLLVTLGLDRASELTT